MKSVLYIHGMGGGGDSRIPSVLSSFLSPAVQVVCRTYCFDPETASSQIACWMEELHPDLVIGESLGAFHALRVRNVPVLLVSPALNAPLYFGFLAWLTLIPGVTWFFDRIYRPREGDRQPLHFTFGVLRKYMPHRRDALNGHDGTVVGNVHAFFGTRDHYRRSGIVSIRTWERHFGRSYTLYDGSHFMEDEYIYSLLIPRIENVLKIK